MMPMPITFYAYADNAEEVHELEEALYNFVVAQRLKGAPVTASRLTHTINKFGNNPIVTSYFNGK